MYSTLLETNGMTKILSSSYVQSALQTLLFSADNLQKTQLRASSGLKVAEAADNAGYWSTSQKLKSEGKVLTSVGDALTLGAAKVDTTYESVSSMIELLDKIKTQLTTAKEPSADRDSINASLSSLKSNLESVAKSASFSGDNWLYNNNEQLVESKSIPYSYKKGADGAITLQYLTIKTSETTLVDSSDPRRGVLTSAVDAAQLNPQGTATPRDYYLLHIDGTTAPAGTEIKVSADTTQEQLDDMISVVSDLSRKVQGLGSSLGTMSSRINQQTSFVKGMGDSLDLSVSRLIDADMTEESTKLAAYKSQRELAVEMVSMANSFRRSLNDLFG